MKENLEDFIRANREAFDDREPSAKVWNTIESRLFGKQASTGALIFWRAAAVLFMGLSAFLLYSRYGESRDNRLVMREFKDVESFYVREISDKVEMIEASRGTEAGLNGFTEDFKQLEAMYEVLKDEMRVRPSKKVKEALVLNLLVRIDLLNQQLHKIDQETGGEDEQVEKRNVSI
ncbi:MAG: hypothetical protein KF725_04135 [Cyclobacteriaceae bacterium]|nr:hypothetical protein [Cyclobacteriaceae bacterium]UYN85673.1 MAG: hypothetical protein KIT51_12415 [Cyclobacteriaceae bacterium]